MKEPSKPDHREKEANPTIRRSALPRTPPNKERVREYGQEMGAEEKAGDPAYTISDPEETIERTERTPRTRNRAHSLPESTVLLERVPLPGETDEERPKKRKREQALHTSTNPEGRKEEKREQEQFMPEDAARLTKMITEAREMTRKVLDIAGQLSLMVEKNVNTKVEIKKGISELAGISVRLDRRSEKILEPIEKLINRSLSKEVELVNCAVQTEKSTKEDREEREREVENQVLQKIEEGALQGNAFEDFMEVMNLKWPSKCFRKVATERTGVFAIPRDWDLATFVTTDFDMDKGVNRKIRDHFQGLDELKQQVEEVGDVAYLVENISFPAKDGTRLNRERYICYGAVAEVARDTWNMRDVYDVLLRLKTLMLRHDRKKIALVATNKMTLGFLRKATEFAFAGSEVEVKILMETRDKAGEKVDRTKGVKTNAQEGAKKRDELVIVKTESGKSFADTLKKLRTEIDMTATGAKVVAIRETRSGDVLLRLKAQQGDSHSQAQSLKEAIAEKMPDVRVQTSKEPEVTVHINGLDGVTDKEELERAVRSTMTNPTAMVKINGLWPAFGQCQNASVTLHRREAEELIEKGSLTVGWVTCKVRERLNIKRCFKCWGYGHYAGKCRGTNREQACMKCGMEGHKAKECLNEEVCWDCEERGHRGGTARCPKFRQMLAEVEKSKRRPLTNYD